VLRTLDVRKIGSVVRRLQIGSPVTVRDEVDARAGSVVAVRVLTDKETYNTLEDAHGRMVRLHRGDLLVGALGVRSALHGYAGEVPETVGVGSRLALLNLGGIMGECRSWHPSVGPPFEVEVLGQVMLFPHFGHRAGVPADLTLRAFTAEGEYPQAPVIYIVGSSMDSGKTTFACALIRTLASQGLRVSGVKTTGVSLLRDTLAMQDHGAGWTCDFTDAGLASTRSGTAVSAARRIFHELAHQKQDVIVVETGDGLLGEYGVREILDDPTLLSLGVATVFCAQDPVGAWGGVRLLAERWGIQVALVSGPVTDNEVGRAFIRTHLGCPAVNAFEDPLRVLDVVRSSLPALFSGHPSLSGPSHG
jgi:hypothetical protein